MIEPLAIHRWGLVEILRRAGGFVMVGVAKDVRSALRHLILWEPDVVVIDGATSETCMVLPILGKLRARDPKIGVVFHSLGEMPGAGFRRWVDDGVRFVPRPSEVEGLVTALRQVVDPEVRAKRGAIRSDEAKGRRRKRGHLPRGVANGLATTVSENGAWIGLTPRELEVAIHFVRGGTPGEIASRLGVRLKTLENHRVRIMRKLGVHSRIELLRLGLRMGLSGGLEAHAEEPVATS